MSAEEQFFFDHVAIYIGFQFILKVHKRLPGSIASLNTNTNIKSQKVTMSRQSKSLNEAVQLLQVAELISKTAQIIVSEWSKETEKFKGPTNKAQPEAPPQVLPSQELYQAQRTIFAALGKLTELVAEPSIRILEVATQFQESRSLYIAAERRIPDFLATNNEGNGSSISEISEETKIESRNLCKFLNSSLQMI
jgi:hypothetical protein